MFAEGVRIPAVAASRQQSNNGIMNLSVRVAPTPLAFRCPPNTIIQAFVPWEQEGKKEYVLFGEGRLKRRNIVNDRNGGRYVSLDCMGFEGDWAQFKLGFNIGQDAGMHLPRLMRLFVGLSTGESAELESLIEGFSQADAQEKLGSLGDPGERLPFLSFYFFLAKLVEKLGPVSALAHVVNNLHAFHPLYRQLYNAMKVQRRIGYSENRRIVEYLGQDVMLKAFFGRIESMPNDASLFDVIKMFLPDTLHHFAPVGSPYFNPDALHRGTPNIVNAEAEERTARMDEEAADTRSSDLEERAIQTQALLDGTFAREAAENATRFLRPTAGDDGESEEALPLMAIPSPMSQSEQWMPPVNSPAGSEDGQLYGATRSYGGHTGIDYPVVRGTLIRAVRTGRVVYARNSGSGYGLKVEIDHGDGYKSLYAHLSQISVQEGSTIQGGVVIGESGNSGGNYGYHLHFGIYRNGVAQDPNRLLGNTTQVSPYRLEAVKSTPTYKLQEGAGAMPTLIIKPELEFSPPPPCNVFFPHHYTSITAREDFARSPTRLMLFGNPYFAQMGQMGSVERTAATPLHFAPRYLRFIFNALRGGQRTGGLDVGQNPNEINGDVQAYLQALKNAPGADTLRIQDDGVARAILEQSRRQQDAQNRSSEDIIEGIINGQTDAPEGLAGLFTYDELFRGIIPSVGQFPFIEDASSGKEIEQRVLDALQANASLLAESFPESQSAPFRDAYQRSATDGAPSTALDLYAGHRFAVMRREASTAGIMGPLNLNVVCGFTGAFYEPTLGWTYGMVESVNDEIDANGVATTTVSFSKCTFMGDLDDPIYSKFRTESEAEASSLAASGVPENPAFFEDRFSANEVGSAIYEPLIGQKSILDLVREGEETLSTDQALTTLIERYRSQRSPALWGDRITGRRIATEGEVMQYILEATPRNYEPADDAPPIREQRHEEYEAQYAVHELPTTQQSFMEERSAWARRYRDDLRKRNMSLHAIDPAPPGLDDSEDGEDA